MREYCFALFLIVLLGGAVWMASVPERAGADVLVLKNGNRLEGIVTAAPGNPNAVMFRGNNARLKINRDKVAEIVEEEDAMDWRRLGDQFYETRQYLRALEAYEKALGFAPGSSVLLEKKVLAEEAVEREATAARREELLRIDGALNDVEKLIGQEEFEAALALLDKIVAGSELAPEQSRREMDLRKTLHKDWGLYLVDRLSLGPAAMHFEKVLEIDPLDEVAYEQLLRIWQRDASKNPQVIDALRIQLRREPGDHEARKMLADKYLDEARRMQIEGGSDVGVSAKAEAYYLAAMENYEQLLAAKAINRSEVSSKMAGVLEGLFNQALQEEDLDRAIELREKIIQLTGKNLSAGYRQITVLQFEKEARALEPDDVDGRTSLVLRMRDANLNLQAEELFSRLEAKFPEHEAVQRLQQQFAEEMIRDARLAYGAGDYSRAESLALQAYTKYPESESIRKSAEQIMNLSRLERERLQSLTTETGRNFKEEGDRYFSEGIRHLNMYQSTERDTTIRVVDYKQEAINAFEKADSNYRKALREWKNMDTATRQAVQDNLKTAQRYLRRLKSSTPIKIPLNR